MVVASIVDRSDSGEFTKLYCKNCGEKFRNIVLKKGSYVTGLNLACPKCKKINAIESR